MKEQNCVIKTGNTNVKPMPIIIMRKKERKNQCTTFEITNMLNQVAFISKQL